MKIFPRHSNGFIKLAAAIFVISCTIGISLAVVCSFSGNNDENITGEILGIREQDRARNDGRPAGTDSCITSNWKGKKLIS